MRRRPVHVGTDDLQRASSPVLGRLGLRSQPGMAHGAALSRLDDDTGVLQPGRCAGLAHSDGMAFRIGAAVHVDRDDGQSPFQTRYRDETQGMATFCNLAGCISQKNMVKDY